MIVEGEVPSMGEITQQDVLDALSEVMDPELDLNVVDLGLVYEVMVEEGNRIRVLMTMTTPGCPAVDYIRRGAEQRLLSIPGAEDAHVDLTWSPPWSPDRMSEKARWELGM